MHVAITKHQSFFWFNGYAGLLMASVFFLMISRMALIYHRTAAAARMHDLIIDRVLYFPVSFFDVTPTGRIINRFSQDLATIDETIAQTMSQVLGMFGSLAGGT